MYNVFEHSIQACGCILWSLLLQSLFMHCTAEANETKQSFSLPCLSKNSVSKMFEQVFWYVQ